ncbi:unnamed protein product, partial [Rotaria magnacalcarata]
MKARQQRDLGLAILPDTPLVQSKPELPRSDDIEVRWEDLDVDERK